MTRASNLDLILICGAHLATLAAIVLAVTA